MSVETVSVAPDACARVLDFVKTTAKVPEEEAAACAGKWDAVVELMTKYCSTLCGVETDEAAADVEACFGVAVSEAKDVDAVKVAAALAAPGLDRAGLRFRVMHSLYVGGFKNNSADKAADQVQVLLQAVSVGKDVAECQRVLEATLNDVAAGASALDAVADAKARRAFELALATSATASSKASEAGTRRAQVFRLRYLRSFDNDDDDDKTGAVIITPPKEALDLAAAAAADAVRDPFTWFRERQDLLNIRAVAALATSKDKTHQALHSLLVVVAQKGFADLVAFADEHAQLFKDHKLDRPAVETAMRLLVLAALAANADSVPYADVAAALAVDVDAVETWVVKAITNDLLECKMDQLNKLVVINRCCLFRTSGAEDWKAVQTQLRTWKANIAKLQATIAEGQAMAV